MEGKQRCGSDGKAGGGALLLASDDHAAITAVANEARAFRRSDEDAAIDASETRVGARVVMSRLRAVAHLSTVTHAVVSHT